MVCDMPLKKGNDQNNHNSIDVPTRFIPERSRSTCYRGVTGPPAQLTILSKLSTVYKLFHTRLERGISVERVSEREDGERQRVREREREFQVNPGVSGSAPSECNIPDYVSNQS